MFVLTYSIYVVDITVNSGIVCSFIYLLMSNWHLEKDNHSQSLIHGLLMAFWNRVLSGQQFNSIKLDDADIGYRPGRMIHAFYNRRRNRRIIRIVELESFYVRGCIGDKGINRNCFTRVIIHAISVIIVMHGNSVVVTQ